MQALTSWRGIGISSSRDVEAGHESRGCDGGHVVNDGLLHVALDRLHHRRVGDGAESPEYEIRDINSIEKPNLRLFCYVHVK